MDCDRMEASLAMRGVFLEDTVLFKGLLYSVVGAFAIIHFTLNAGKLSGRWKAFQQLINDRLALSKEVRAQLEIQRLNRAREMLFLLATAMCVIAPIVGFLHEGRGVLNIHGTLPYSMFKVGLMPLLGILANSLSAVTTGRLKTINVIMVCVRLRIAFDEPRELLLAYWARNEVTNLWAGFVLPMTFCLPLSFGTVALKLITAWHHLGRPGFADFEPYARLELMTWVLVVIIFYHTNAIDILAAKRKLDTTSLEQTHSAVHSLLKARCDAVVELDADLCVCAASTQLLAIFGLHHAGSHAFDGVDFTKLILSNEDRERFRHCCIGAANVESSTSHPRMADVLHVTMRTPENDFGVSQESAFDVRLFHVWFSNEGRQVSHLVGLCLGPNRPEALAQDGALAQTHLMALPVQSETTDSRNSTGTAFAATGALRMRVTFDALSESLDILDYTDAWADVFVSPAECGCQFLAFLQPHVNKAMFGDWGPTEEFSKVTVRNKQDGLFYSGKLVLRLPDPLVAYNAAEQVYFATLSFEHARLKRLQPKHGDLTSLAEE